MPHIAAERLSKHPRNNSTIVDRKQAINDSSHPLSEPNLERFVVDSIFRTTFVKADTDICIQNDLEHRSEAIWEKTAIKI